MGWNLHISALNGPEQSKEQLHQRKMQVSRMVDVQVVCKVTDPEVLLRGETKRFTNQVTLQTTDGQNINTATSPADITAQKIDKSMAATNPVSEKVNFTIEANQLGQTLPTVEGTTLKLIDKMSSTLILDTTTILSSGFEILFEKSPKRIAVRKVNQATSASCKAIASLLVDDLLDSSSQSFVLAAFRPQDFFSDGGDCHDVQVVVIDRLSVLLWRFCPRQLAAGNTRYKSDRPCP